MEEPVLVIHGVANRSRAEFTAQVANLARDLGGPWDLIPVFWGDLGARDEAIADTLPDVVALSVPAAAEALDPVAFGGLMATPESGPQVRSESEGLEAVERAALGASAEASAEAVRGETEAEEEVRQGIEEQWPHTDYLRQVRDPALLAAAGRLIGAGVGQRAVEGAGESLTRGGYEEDFDPYQTRALFPNIRERVKSLVAEVDKLVGLAVGDVLGRINQRLRGAGGPYVAEFLGDVFVYQRNRAAIRQRIWEAIEQRAPGYGGESRPINVVAHSLGGVISFDAAVAGRPPLWVKALVTFGSQSAFFHVLDRREELDPYRQGFPVTLPRQIGRWTNLWEPMDPLAFTAGKVFRLHDGRSPEDVPVQTAASRLVEARLWTHSVYWTSDELLRALRQTLAH